MVEAGDAARGRAWGPRNVALGAVLVVVAYLFTMVLLFAIVAALGREFQTEDTPPFEAAAELAHYADERLKAAAEGAPLPAPPRFAGDLVTARAAYLMGIVNAALLIVASFVAMGRWRKDALRLLGLGRYAFGRVWKPALVTLGAYATVVVYTVIVTALDIDLLKPKDVLQNSSIVRDGWGLAIFGFVAVVAAPLSEETFFRGLLFGGFARWGFYPAAAISGLTFSLAHLDPGTLIPFTLIGIWFAWLFRSTGSLWDSIIAHSLFNTTSFLLLLTRV